MVGTFARLKLSLLRNGFRGGLRGNVVVQFRVVTMIWAAAASGGAALGLALSRGQEWAPDLILVAHGFLVLGWLVLPVTAFGVDETLDPSRLALFPLRPAQLMTGLVAASAIGVGPIATAVVLAGTVVAASTSVGGTLAAMVGAALTLVVCIVGSRLVTTALAGVLRGRWGRSIGAVVVLILPFLGLAPSLLMATTQQPDSVEIETRLADWADVFSAMPVAWGGDVVRQVVAGGTGAAAVVVAELLGLAGLLLLMVSGWWFALRRLSSTSESSQSGRGRRRVWGPQARTRAAAVAARELRGIVRDPMLRVGWLQSLVVPLILGVSWSVSPGPTRHLVAYLGCYVAVMVPTPGANTFGTDGPAYWMHVAAAGGERADLLGKHIAWLVLSLPLVTLATVVAAARTDRLEDVPGLLGLAFALLGASIVNATLGAVLFPYAVPERKNVFAGTGSNPGCLPALVMMAGLLVAVALAAPILLLRLALPDSAGSVVLVAGAAYGGGLMWLTRRALAGRLARRAPDVLAAVLPRRAG